MAGRRDPYSNARFELRLGNIKQAAFSECTGFDITTDPIEYREGTDKEGAVRKQPGLTKYGNITLKWGLSDSTEIWDWRKKVIDGKMEKARINGSIVVKDEEGNDKIQWDFVNGWPSKYDPSDLNAKGNDIAIETLEITHEGLKLA